MEKLLFLTQIISGVISAFFILIHDPKSEGLGAIGSSAHSFKGVRTSADDKLDNLTWFFVILFIVSSALLGFSSAV